MTEYDFILNPEAYEQSRHLPDYVVREFDDYLKCGRLEHGFLRVRCESCHHEKRVAFSCKRRGFCPSCGAVTLIQRFGSALNLNLHFHMLYLNGVYDRKGYFWLVKPPNSEDLARITHTITRM